MSATEAGVAVEAWYFRRELIRRTADTDGSQGLSTAVMLRIVCTTMIQGHILVPLMEVIVVVLNCFGCIPQTLYSSDRKEAFFGVDIGVSSIFKEPLKAGPCPSDDDSVQKILLSFSA